MDIGTFLRFADAIRAIYELRFEPREDAFTECSSDQHASLERQGHDLTRRWFVVTGGWFDQDRPATEELPLVDDAERQLLLATAAWITKVTDASGEPFASFEARLQSLTSNLPEVLWKPAAPAPRRPHLHLVP